MYVVSNTVMDFHVSRQHCKYGMQIHLNGNTVRKYKDKHLDCSYLCFATPDSAYSCVISTREIWPAVLADPAKFVLFDPRQRAGKIGTGHVEPVVVRLALITVSL